eukprot:scaffold38515_cov191-Amphora_coffeaeformis.AAC.1
MLMMGERCVSETIDVCGCEKVKSDGDDVTIFCFFGVFYLVRYREWAISRVTRVGVLLHPRRSWFTLPHPKNIILRIHRTKAYLPTTMKHPKHFQDRTLKPLAVSLLVGLATFFAYYQIFGGGTTKAVDRPVVQGDGDVNFFPAFSPKIVDDSDSQPAMTAEEEKIEKMREKLQPKNLVDVDGKLLEHQFLHLHHMKTGGTSMDSLMSCAMRRMRSEQRISVPYANIHECAPGHYRKCLSGADARCLDEIKAAAFMSYCAPLKDLGVFEWQPSEESPIHALTVLRNPVERVWSMYRFQTKHCYKCKTLKEVYADYDQNDPQDNCSTQLMNHQTRNLITKEEGSDEEKVKQAIDDLENFFTFVGLTEDIPSTAAMVGMVFPWMAEQVNGTSTTCPFPHANASPSNNRCGPGKTHWDLPPHPDEETAELIRQHNQLDIQVYEAA